MTAPHSTDQFLVFCKLVSCDRSFQHHNENFNRSLRLLDDARDILVILEDIFKKEEVIFSLAYLAEEYQNEYPLHLLEHLQFNGEAIDLSVFADFKSCILVMKDADTLEKYRSFIERRARGNLEKISIQTENGYKIFFTLKKNK